MAYWLVKTEPITYSIDHLAKERRTNWHGVRNYQARNFLKAMKVGDKVLVYHSVTEPVGVAGLAEVAKEAYADPSQFDKKSEYFDGKATKEKPIWFCPDLKFARKFPEVLSLKAIRALEGLEGLELLRRGSRLSVHPLSERHFDILCRAAEKDG